MCGSWLACDADTSVCQVHRVDAIAAWVSTQRLKAANFYCGEQACPALGCEAALTKTLSSFRKTAVPLLGAASQPNAGQACSPQQPTCHRLRVNRLCRYLWPSQASQLPHKQFPHFYSVFTTGRRRRYRRPRPLQSRFPSPVHTPPRPPLPAPLAPPATPFRPWYTSPAVALLPTRHKPVYQ